MNDNEICPINKVSDYLVIKSNTLVLDTRYQFSMIEQKTIAYICSMIRPQQGNSEGGYVLEYELNILDYAAICGIERNGYLYNNVKKALKGLRDKSMWLTLPDRSETTVGWLDNVTVTPNSGTVKIRIDKNLAPYLFELKTRYLSYGLNNILCMSSSFSIRLYEMFKAYLGLQYDNRARTKRINDPIPYEWEIPIDELKHKLMVDTIPSYQRDNNNFRLKVLEPAHREINSLSDISFEYEMLKKSNRVYAVRFTIAYKDMLERSQTELARNKLLSKAE